MPDPHCVCPAPLLVSLLLQISVFINMFVTCVFAAGFYGEPSDWSSCVLLLHVCALC